MVWPDGNGRLYGMALQAWHSIAWRGMGWCMVWPGGMTCIWYGLVGMAWYMAWFRGMAMVYGVVWRAWHGIWYGLSGMT